MNIIVRLLTVSLMVNMLAFGFAGYAGMKYTSPPLAQALEDLQTGFGVMLQDIAVLTGDIPTPALARPYYEVVETPLPIVYDSGVIKLF